MKGDTESQTLFPAEEVLPPEWQRLFKETETGQKEALPIKGSLTSAATQEKTGLKLKKKNSDQKWGSLPFSQE